jgi:hypothetical protein
MGAPRLTDADDLLDDSRRFRLALAYDGKHHSALGPPERWRRRPARVASSRVCLGKQRPMGCPGGPCFLRKPRTSRRLLSRSGRPRKGRLLRRRHDRADRGRRTTRGRAIGTQRRAGRIPCATTSLRRQRARARPDTATRKAIAELLAERGQVSGDLDYPAHAIPGKHARPKRAAAGM